jgi:hypothetical protein
MSSFLVTFYICWCLLLDMFDSGSSSLFQPLVLILPDGSGVELNG